MLVRNWFMVKASVNMFAWDVFKFVLFIFFSYSVF